LVTEQIAIPSTSPKLPRHKQEVSQRKDGTKEHHEMQGRRFAPDADTYVLETTGNTPGKSANVVTLTTSRGFPSVKLAKTARSEQTLDTLTTKDANGMFPADRESSDERLGIPKNQDLKHTKKLPQGYQPTSTERS
jgi:hypothetical protein